MNTRERRLFLLESFKSSLKPEYGANFLQNSFHELKREGFNISVFMLFIILLGLISFPVWMPISSIAEFFVNAKRRIHNARFVKRVGVFGIEKYLREQDALK